MRRHHVLLAVTAVLLLLFAACGGDDDDDNATDTGTNSEQNDGGDGGNEDAGSDTTGDVDIPEGFTSDECEELAEAIGGVAAAFTGASDFNDVAEFFDEVADKAPDEIKDDIETLAEASQNFAEAADDAGIDFSDPSTLTPEKLQELSDEAEAFNEGEVKEASDRIDAYAKEKCGVDASS